MDRRFRCEAKEQAAIWFHHGEALVSGRDQKAWSVMITHIAVSISYGYIACALFRASVLATLTIGYGSGRLCSVIKASTVVVSVGEDGFAATFSVPT